MARLILTLLALLTGLMAQVSPAQTVLRGSDAEIGVSLAAASADRRATPAAHPSQGDAQAGSEARRCTILMLAPERECQPAAYIVGVDRSLE